MKVHILLILYLLILSFPLKLHATDTRKVAISSTAHDSVTVNGIYIGVAPCSIELKEGIYSFSVYKGGVATSKRLLIQPGDSTQKVFIKALPVPKWNSSVTLSQKKVIERIIDEMLYMNGNAKSAPFFIEKYVVSVTDWETITGETFPLRMSKDLRSSKSVLPAFGLTYAQVQFFLSKLKHLSGIEFTLPNVVQQSILTPETARYNYSHGILYENADKRLLVYRKDCYGPDKKCGVYYCPELWELTGDDRSRVVGFLKYGLRKNTVDYYDNINPLHTCFRLCVNLEKIDGDQSRTVALNRDIKNEEQLRSEQFKTLFAENLTSANDGDSEAMRILGVLLHKGLGTPKDDILAKEWLIKAVKNGNLPALLHLAYFAKYGIAMPQSYSVACDIYRYLIEKNYPVAIVRLGECYYNGWGVIESKKTAIEYFKAAAEKGDAEALYQLGRTYMQGAEKDLSKAADCFLEAIDKSDCPPEAYYEMGNWCREMEKEDGSLRSTGTDYYRLGYLSGSAEAQLMYAYCLHTGYGCEKDDELSACVLYEYLRNPLGAFNRKGYVAERLGTYTTYGYGLCWDKNNRDKWLKMAIDHDYIPAAVKLAEHSKGDDAIYWYSYAAERGDADGQYQLAKIYNTGKDVEMDKKTALYWMKEADKSGCMDPYFFEDYKSLKIEMRVQDTVHLDKMPDKKVLWDDGMDYLTSDWRRVAEKYGRQSAQTAVSVFYYKYFRDCREMLKIS